VKEKDIYIYIKRERERERERERAEYFAVGWGVLRLGIGV
jgi:hypothetical protein